MFTDGMDAAKDAPEYGTEDQGPRLTKDESARMTGRYPNNKTSKDVTNGPVAGDTGKDLHT